MKVNGKSSVGEYDAHQNRCGTVKGVWVLSALGGVVTGSSMLLMRALHVCTSESNSSSMSLERMLEPLVAVYPVGFDVKHMMAATGCGFVSFSEEGMEAMAETGHFFLVLAHIGVFQCSWGAHVSTFSSGNAFRALGRVLQFNWVRVEIHELSPKVVIKDAGVLVYYRGRTNVWWRLTSKALA